MGATHISWGAAGHVHLSQDSGNQRSCRAETEIERKPAGAQGGDRIAGESDDLGKLFSSLALPLFEGLSILALGFL